MLYRLKGKWRLVLVWSMSGFTLLWTAPGLNRYLVNADHGYQLSMGKQVLLGKFPFVDLFFHYGPLTAFTSAFGLWISDSLIPETVICALGYATALLLIHYLTYSYVSGVAGWLTPILGFLLLSRFYKWYYWLFPLLALYCLHVFLHSNQTQSRPWLYIVGIFGGLAGLYRLDLGAAFLGFYVVSLLGLCGNPFNVGLFIQRFTKFLIGFLFPFLVWLVVLWGNGGTIQDYIGSTVAGGKGAVEKLSLPFPSFDLSNPLPHQSNAALAFALIPLTYILCLFFGGWIGWSSSTRNNTKGKFMAAVGLMGLGIFPQALHRSDVPHLLQVLPPVLIAGSLLVSELWNGAILSKNNSWGRFFLKLAVGFYLVLIISSGWGIRHYGGVDLVKWERNPIPRYQRLAQGIRSGLDHPIIRLVLEVQTLTTENARILVVPWASQLYYFVNRPLSGLLNVFAPGVLDNNEWRHRNLGSIQKDPPAIVIVRDNFFDLPLSDMFRESQPELYTFLATQYSQVVYQRDGWMLLKRKPTILLERF